MTLDGLETLDIIETLEGYLSKNRPPTEIRNQLDISYKIEGQSVLLTEIRPAWDRPKEIIERPFAKATFVRTKKIWKIYWLRADLKWHLYKPNATVKTIKKFLDVVEIDEYGCFKG